MESIADSKKAAEFRVLEADPDLAAGLPPDQARIAAERACVRAEVLDVAHLNEPADRPDGTVGLLVLDGLVTRTLRIGDRTSTELLGTGDLLRPWQPDDQGILPFAATWQVLEPTRVAVLDDGFAAAIAPWPQIWSELLGRMMRRSRAQAMAMTLSHMNRVDDRLLLAFWLFADRWGRVRPDGVVLRLPLTHETLGALVGARRPSVTSALGELAREKLLVRGDGRGEWILTNAARARIEAARTAANGDQPLPALTT